MGKTGTGAERVVKEKREEKLLVKKVKGEKEVYVGQKVKYEVTDYNKNKSEVTENDKKSIKWAAIVDGKFKFLFEKGEIIELKIRKEWEGKELTLMPYLISPQKDVAVKIDVVKFVFPIIIDLYKMPGLNEDGADIAKDMAYGFGTKYFNPIYDANTIQQYKNTYKNEGFNRIRHNVFSNAEELELPPTTNNSKGTVYDQLEKINKAKNRKAIYNKEDFPAVAKFLNNLTSDFGGIEGHSDYRLFADFKDMAKVFFAPFSAEMRKNIDNMIEHFKANKGGVYENAILTKDIKDHESTNRYCKEVEEYIAKKLKEHKGNINKLEDKRIYFTEEKDVMEKRKKFYSLTPLYPAKFSWEGAKNATQGRTIALNDIWATEIVITEYELNENNYTGKYQVTLYDHFGLDDDDIKAGKFAGWGAGFRAWFILQHFRGYKPFVTKITFERPFRGEI